MTCSFQSLGPRPPWPTYLMEKMTPVSSHLVHEMEGRYGCWSGLRVWESLLLGPSVSGPLGRSVFRRQRRKEDQNKTHWPHCAGNAAQEVPVRTALWCQTSSSSYRQWHVVAEILGARRGLPAPHMLVCELRQVRKASLHLHSFHWKISAVHGTSLQCPCEGYMS